MARKFFVGGNWKCVIRLISYQFTHYLLIFIVFWSYYSLNVVYYSFKCVVWLIGWSFFLSILEFIEWMDEWICLVYILFYFIGEQMFRLMISWEFWYKLLFFIWLMIFSWFFLEWNYWRSEEDCWHPEWGWSPAAGCCGCVNLICSFAKC